MHKIGSLRTLRCLLGLLLTIVSESAAQQKCGADARSPVVSKSFADSLSRRFGGANVDSSEVHLATTRLTLGSECLVGATFSWNDGFEGGIILLAIRQHTNIVLRMERYPGAHSPIPAGDGRIAFSYSAGRGSGYAAERTAVLCAIAEDNWVPCLDMLTGQEIAATGYPISDSLARGVRFGMHTTIRVARDTLLLRTIVRMKKYGRGPETMRVILSRIPLP